jgi:uncharacterized integral membrane protein (TIGR00698 family)
LGSKQTIPRRKKLRLLTVTTRQLLFIILLVLCFTPLITPPVALLLGLIVAQFIGHPFLKLNQKATALLLQASVVGLGFGMNVNSALKAGKEGLAFSIISIFGTLLLGALLGKLFRVEKKTSYLIATGTAICGGSAIAAVAPVIEAKESEISVALGTIFILNAVALFIFPMIGHALHLSQMQFGLWSAVAIHDTSSVAGAAGRYGTVALEIATTVKLARALWIIPIVIATAFIFKNKARKIKVPWFIGFFVIAMLLNTYVAVVKEMAPYITGIAKTGLTLSLFLIGAGLSPKALALVGARPLVQAVLLWVIISAAALCAVIEFA